MWEDFKKFVFRGNVIDLAVAVIIGLAFGRIVTSLVNDIIMPLIGLIMGGISFSELAVTHNNAVLAYGLFLQSIVDFLIIAGSIFFVLRILIRKKKEEEAPLGPSAEALLLTEIRDLLQKEK